jgi:hypothetical protein
MFVECFHRRIANVLPFMQFPHFLAQRNKSRSYDRMDFKNRALIFALQPVARGAVVIPRGRLSDASAERKEIARFLRLCQELLPSSLVPPHIKEGQTSSFKLDAGSSKV